MIICSVYNNRDILNAGLLSSREKILSSCKLVLIDNRTGKFNSFASALHSILPSLPELTPLVIAHQDVLFYDITSFEMLNDYIQNIQKDDLFLAGVAGQKEQKGYKEGIGFNQIISGGSVLQLQPILKPTTVDTFDEVVIITNRKTIQSLQPFHDERFAWHLYAVDACLEARSKYIQPYVFPLKINHLSSSSADANYLKLAPLLLEKHKKEKIYTTCGLISHRIVKARKIKIVFSSIFKKMSTPVKSILKFSQLDAN